MNVIFLGEIEYKTWKGARLARGYCSFAVTADLAVESSFLITFKVTESFILFNIKWS